MRDIVFFATDVAPLLNQHPYQSQLEAFERVIKRVSPETYGAVWGPEVVDEVVEQKVREVEQAVVKTGDAEEAQRIIEAVTAGLSEEKKAEVVSAGNCAFGTAQEAKVVETMEVAGPAVTHRNDKFYKKWYEGDIRWGVGGRIDGLQDGQLVEIKNRMNRLFRCVRRYEWYQVQVYMEILDLPSCSLVERYRNRKMTHPVERDEEHWNNVVVPGLRNMATYITSFVNSEEEQSQWVELSDEQRAQLLVDALAGPDV